MNQFKTSSCHSHDNLSNPINCIGISKYFSCHNRLHQLLIGSALAVLATWPAEAALIHTRSFVATTNYSLNNGASTTVNNSSSTNVDIINYYSSVNDNVFFHVYGDGSDPGNIVFGSRSSGQGIFTATGTLHYKDVIENTGSASESVVFNYVVTSGDLSVVCSGSPTCDGSAKYQIDIKKDNISMDFSSRTLMFDSAGKAAINAQQGFSLGGTVLSGIGTESATYSWDYTAKSLNLGSLAPDQQMTLDYDLITTAVGNFVYGEKITGCIDYPELGLTACSGIAGTGGTEARIGDPSGVPEPGALALFGVAAIGFVIRRRR